MNFKEITKESLEEQARKIHQEKVAEFAARLLTSVFVIGMLLIMCCVAEKV